MSNSDVLTALKRHVAFEDIITSISSEFINVPFERIDDVIDDALQRIGAFAEVDRTYVFRYTSSRDSFDNTHEWCADGIEPQKDNLQNVPTSVAPWWMGKLKKFETVHIPSIDSLPPEASGERELLSSQGIASLIAVPMVYEGILKGFIGFDSVRQKKTWDEDSIKLLKLVGEIFANALARQEIDRVKTEFVSLASHQLRTPVSVIKWNLEIFMKKGMAILPPELQGYITTAYETGDEMAKLINALLHVSRIEIGSFSPAYTPIRILSIAQRILSQLTQVVTEKRLHVKTHYTQPVHNLVVSDKRVVEIVLQNLLLNAVTYTPEQGSITLSIDIGSADSLSLPPSTPHLSDRRDFVFVSVCDTGFGIPSSQQKKIFTKFFRADNAQKRGTKGNGLGLYLVRSTLDLIGGLIWFESEEDHETTFYALIPVKK